MAYDLDEQEQIDQLRAWWAKYGTAVLTVLVVAMAVLGGWRGWQWYETSQAVQARGYFEALEEAGRQQGDESVARINAAMQTLRSEFGSTDYAARGALVAASALASRNELQGARETAAHFGARHEEWVVTPDCVKVAEHLAWYYDEPFADASAIPSYYVAELARRHVKVVLTGDGGDEREAR